MTNWRSFSRQSPIYYWFQPTQSTVGCKTKSPFVLKAIYSIYGRLKIVEKRIELISNIGTVSALITPEVFLGGKEFLTVPFFILFIIFCSELQWKIIETNKVKNMTQLHDSI